MKFSMKKKLNIIFFVLLIGFNLIAEEKPLWAGTESGDYVVYQDLSWKEPTWVGFLYYDDNTIGSFLYTAGGKVFAKVLFSGEILDGEFVITGQNNISGINTDPNYTYAINYLMDIMPKLYLWKNQNLRESLVVKTGSKIIHEEQFGSESEVTFRSYIPLFRVQSILDNNKKAVFQLVEMGKVNNENVFFNFKPLHLPLVSNSKFILNTKAVKEQRIVDGLKLFLDSQWKQIADNTFLMGNEAFLNINTIDLKTIQKEKNTEIDFLIKLFSSSGEATKILVKDTDISGSRQKFKIINSVYDIATNSIKNDIKLIIKNNNSEYTIISLTVDKSSYKKYKDYFDSLF